MGTVFGREPALIIAVVHAGIALAIGFGLQITVQQFALIEVFVIAVLALITRQNVTPVASPNVPVGTPVNGGTAVVASL